MRKHSFFVAVALLLTACASNPSPFSEGGGTTLQVVVENEMLQTVTAFVDWGAGGRTRLDEIPAGETRTFTVGVDGQMFRVEFATIGGRSRALSERVQARAGDTFQWVLRSNGTVFYRRLR